MLPFLLHHLLISFQRLFLLLQLLLLQPLSFLQFLLYCFFLGLLELFLTKLSFLFFLLDLVEQLLLLVLKQLLPLVLGYLPHLHHPFNKVLMLDLRKLIFFFRLSLPTLAHFVQLLLYALELHLQVSLFTENELYLVWLVC